MKQTMLGVVEVDVRKKYDSNPVDYTVCARRQGRAKRRRSVDCHVSDLALASKQLCHICAKRSRHILRAYVKPEKKAMPCMQGLICKRERYSFGAAKPFLCSVCAPWERSLLRQLHSLLKGLSPLRRHDVLSVRLSESQRLTLERWILTHARAVGSPALVGSRDRKVRKRGKLATKLRHLSAKMRHKPSRVMCRDVRVQHCSAHHPVVVARANGKPLRGIVRHMRRDTKECYYSVSMMVGRLRLLTREDRNRDVVASYHEALSTIQARMVGVSSEGFESAFRLHVNTTLEAHGLDAKAMGLRFCVSLAVLWLPRPLLTSAFGAEGQALDAGLHAWRRLGEARGRVPGRGSVLWVSSPEQIAQTWQHVRAVYLDIMEENGHCRELVSCKLANLEAKQHERQEVMMRRWNCARMAAEEKLQRRLHRHQASEAAAAVAAMKKRQRKEDRMLNAISRLLLRWECRKSIGSKSPAVPNLQNPMLLCRCHKSKLKQNSDAWHGFLKYEGRI